MNEVEKANKEVGLLVKNLLKIPFVMLYVIIISLPTLSYYQTFLLLAVLTMLWKITPVTIKT